MLHLSTDRLAELGDAAPTAIEATHLAACVACGRERDAYVALVTMARADATAVGFPLTRWESIAGELAGASPAAPGWAGAPAVASPAPRQRWPLQLAAGLLICVAGAMLGRASAGATLFPERAMAARTTPAALAAATRLLGDSANFASVEEARAAQEQSELVYERAAAFLAQYDTAGAVGNPVAYRSRLAALDRVISTTRDALREVPHDRVINNYYLTTIEQREATLRQLSTSLPASLRLNSF